jgi:hypothetical protein
MPELTSVSERAHSANDVKEVKNPAENSWVSRALDGFLEGGKEVVTKPIESAVMVGTGLGAGSLIQAGLSGAEHMGGKFGAAARLGRVALVAAPLAYSAYRIAEADDSVKESGKMAFEMGLFMGASKIGSTAVARHFDAKALTYKPVTELPKGVEVKAYGNTAFLSAPRDFMNYPVQVRLANGKGFIANNQGELRLHPMPETVPGVGRLEYGAHKTTLHTEAGGKFDHELRYRSTSTADAAGNKISTGDGTSFSVRRPNGDHVSFEKDGKINATEGSYQSGRDWTFFTDGSISMRSLPGGKYRTHITPEGDGVSSVAHGTSRSIMGRVRGSNHLPIERTEHHFKYDRNNPTDTARHPDITPIDAEVKAALASAANVFKQIGRGSAV